MNPLAAESALPALGAIFKSEVRHGMVQPTKL